VCYGFTIGHVRDNTEALAQWGLARIATTPRLLATELTAALAAGRQVVSRPRADLPSGAEVTMQLARASGPR
jgi:uncharacterized lipoprotein YbaY